MSRALMILRLVPVLAVISGCTPTWVEQEYQKPERFATWVDAPPPAYLLQPGDDISVVMPFNPELNHHAPVAPDGTFTLPLGGIFQAAGRSTAELTADIDRTLAAKGIVANARTSTSLLKDSNKVYVGGQVGQPGEVPLRVGMDVMQAITAAHGMLDTARSHEVVLIRRSPDGSPMLRTIDLNALTRRGDPKQAVALQASDTIFVPQSEITEVNQWVDQYITRILPFNKNVNYSYSNNNNSGGYNNNNYNNNP